MGEQPTWSWRAYQRRRSRSSTGAGRSSRAWMYRLRPQKALHAAWMAAAHLQAGSWMSHVKLQMSDVEGATQGRAGKRRQKSPCGHAQQQADVSAFTVFASRPKPRFLFLSVIRKLMPTASSSQEWHAHSAQAFPTMQMLKWRRLFLQARAVFTLQSH